MKLTGTIGNDQFCILDVPEHIQVQPLDAKSIVLCIICGKEMPLTKMRNHVGQHIIRSMLDIDEGSIINIPVSTFIYKKHKFTHTAPPVGWG